MKVKAVILVGGPQKGTRFRPLSLDLPKPLFPVGGFPLIYHHVEACCKQILGLQEILLIGFYPQSEFKQFVDSVRKEFQIPVKYLQEFTALGTAGGIYHFRDQIRNGDPDCFFLMNADVVCDFPLKEMLLFRESVGLGKEHHIVMVTEATRQQSMNYGCVVLNNSTHEIQHYVEKPQTFVSTTINCGIYLFDQSIIKHLATAFLKSHSSFDMFSSLSEKEAIYLEQEVLRPLAGTGVLYAFETSKFWSQIKSAGAVIYANRHLLAIYHRTHSDYLKKSDEKGPTIIGDVFIHSSATIHESAVLGPNVTIGHDVVVGEGVRIRESMVLDGCTISDHACILHSIIGWGTSVGAWSRIEGKATDPNPNKPFAKLDIPELFNSEGQLNPSTTVIGRGVLVPGGVVILNTVVLPFKDLTTSYKNQIIL